MTQPPADPAVTPPSDVPPGLRAVPSAEPDPQSPAELAAKQAKALHDELAKALAEDPASLILGLPGLLGQQIAQIVAAGVAMALRQGEIPVPRRACSVCQARFSTWYAAHAQEIDVAMLVAAKANGVEPGSPQAQQLDITPFLPEALRPGGKDAPAPVGAEDVLVGGTGYCRDDMPGAQAGKAPLIAMPGVGVHAAVQLARAAGAALPGFQAG